MLRSRIMVVSVLYALSLIGTSAVLADGVMMPHRQDWKKLRERSYINEPEQKAVVFFNKDREDLIISPSYRGPSDRFAWIVPVPSQPKVEILKGAVFHELMKVTSPKRPEFWPTAKSAGSARQTEVAVLERKTVGAYDVSVLSSTNGRALFEWLKANNYHMPEKAIGPINAYVKEKWTFVACRVKAPESAKGLKTGTLAPLRLSFPAKQPVYPIRLSSGNPDPFTVLIYLIIPERDSSIERNGIKLISEPGKHPTGITRFTAELAKNQRKYPTIAKLSREPLQIFVRRESIRPEHCDKDYYWAVPVRRTAR